MSARRRLAAEIDPDYCAPLAGLHAADGKPGRRDGVRGCEGDALL